MNKWHCLIEVEWENPGNDKTRKSSGVPISDKHILTAGHGVDPARNKDVDCRLARDGSAEDKHKARIVWHQHDERIDAALLELVDGPDVTAFTYSLQKPAGDTELVIVGFPAGSIINDISDLRDTDVLRVRYHPAARQRSKGDMSLEVLPQQGKLEDWQGMSGSPVLKGDVIVGVLCSGEPVDDDNDVHKKWLYALSIETLFTTTDIATSLPENNPLKRSLEKDQRCVQHILEKSRSLAKELDSILSEETNHRDEWDLAGSILKLNLLQFLQTLKPYVLGETARLVKGSHDLQVLAELVNYICPKMLRGASIADSDIAGFMTDLPAGNRTIAELLMAQEDARSARFYIPVKGFPRSSLEVPAEPEAGIDVFGDAQSWDASVEAFLIDQLVESDALTGDHEIDRGFLKAELRAKFERNKDGSRSRYYFVYDGSKLGGKLQEMESLSQIYPELAFLNLQRNAEEARDHYKIGTLLRDILKACEGGS